MYEFNEKNHVHTLDGKRLTGVTTVLGIVSKGDGLIQWSANCAAEYIQNKILTAEAGTILENLAQWITESKKAWATSRDTAGEAGTDTHAIVEMIIKYALKKNGIVNGEWDGIVDILMDNDDKKKQIKQFLSWAKENNIKFLESEKNVYSKELWIGGIVDFVFEKDGEVYVGDIKTSKSIYPTNFWQTSAYQFCLQEMGMYPKVKGFTIVRLGRDGSFETKDNFAFDDNIEGFKAALTVYRKLNLITEKKPKRVYTPKKLTTV